MEMQAEAVRASVAAPPQERRWRRFYEKMRIDIIEAQCALESGRTVRASELMDGILSDARRCAERMERR